MFNVAVNSTLTRKLATITPCYGVALLRNTLISRLLVQEAARSNLANQHHNDNGYTP